ncbi:L,D-transpeptidase family protein [Mucilaginibacter limnophilus]|nr:L,D-transpeptidase family protein [Mucilaginibacter limnophilus]
MKSILKILFFLVLQSASKTSHASRTVPPEKVNTDTSFTNLHLTKNAVDAFIKDKVVGAVAGENIRQFYQSRNFQYAWLTEEGLAEQTQTLWGLYKQYQGFSSDSSLYDANLDQQLEGLSSGEESLDLNGQQRLELRLTAFFLRFLKYAYAGKVNPEKLQWHIPKKKLKPVDLLEELMSVDDQNLDEWLPASTGYIAMKEKLIKLQQLRSSDWPVISLDDPGVLKPGDTALVVKRLKQRLSLLGDLPLTDTNAIYDHDFKSAVQSFQRRHGLVVDGIVGPNVMEAINIPIETKLKTILINMERMRWMPFKPAGKRVLVNIPEFRLHFYDGSQEVLSMDVVVGKAATRTVIFSDQIRYVVFSPYWNLPRSIVRNEVLPGMARDAGYLDRHRMEITGRRNGLPVVRQRPGAGNALGRVKFIFPNKYSIYLHDTPAKQLFDRNTRAFSHGCIRVGAPSALADKLLENMPDWTSGKIAAAMASDREHWVKLTDPVPVFITYLTSWVDESGKLNFRQDIYGHDAKLASHLFDQ